jgi:hypothetical protein
MNNRVNTIYLANDAEKKSLTLKPGIAEWEMGARHDLHWFSSCKKCQ